MTKNNFNTSYVVIKHLSHNYEKQYSSHFNTSYVVIKRKAMDHSASRLHISIHHMLLLNKNDFVSFFIDFLNFNTSYVVIKLGELNKCVKNI